MNLPPDSEPVAKPVIIVAGPTASGKSALAVDLAERVSGIVINADSMQIYRGLEILTSAPDAAMRARAPHRLFGVLGPTNTVRPVTGAIWRSRKFIPRMKPIRCPLSWAVRGFTCGR